MRAINSSAGWKSYSACNPAIGSPVHGEFLLMPPSVSGTARGNVAANDIL